MSTFNKTITSPDSIYNAAIKAGIAAAIILLIPLTAMFITDEMKWSPGDFIVAWILLFSAGFAYKLVTRKKENFAYKAGAALGAATALFLIWANLAVGLIGSEDNPANLMFLWVHAVLIVGILISQFRPKGMSIALFATAFTQALIGAVAFVFDMADRPMEIFTITGFFVILWSGSALLFRYAALVSMKDNINKPD